MNTIKNSEIDKFYTKTKQRHRRINPCFMTGKGCVHTEHIDNELEERNTKDDHLSCFMVRPFRPNFDAFNHLCLERYLQSNYSYDLDKLKMEQADRIRRTGYVVCEKICRRVQSVDFVIIDISSPNANVFYELGLAYGIEQKIIVIYQEDSEFGKKAATYLKDAGCKAYPYKDLNPIEKNDFPLSQYIWHPVRYDFSNIIAHPSILLISQNYGFIANAENFQDEIENLNTPDEKIDGNVDENVSKILGPPDIELSIETHVKAAIGVAIVNIVSELEKKEKKSIPEPYIELIQKLKTPDEVKKEANFNEVRQQLDKAYCTIIHTGGKIAEPMSYFWLGYCHSMGKNVIPVTVVRKVDDNIDDLAFDIRALWHMTFSQSNPLIFAGELQETLYQMIISDFAEWSRNRFWDKMLTKRGRVSIFSGALHNEPIGRDMIGDWDLRAASELTSFFASHQYRATIESPVYQIEQFKQKRLNDNTDIIKKDYMGALEDMLKDKNCIIIASADVNPLTEIILGKLYKVPQTKWFTKTNIEKINSSVISFKETMKSKNNDTQSEESNSLGRLFYNQQSISNIDNKRLKRGFKGHGVPENTISGEFLSQKDETASFNVHAHLVIAKNPFDLKSSEQHHIIVLNGVSGPATFALTHVLTGGTSSQFVAYEESFDPNSQSESFLEQVNKDIDDLRKEKVSGIQYFIEVQVGPPKVKKDGGVDQHIFDWRRILNWERVGDTPGMIYSTSSGK